MKCYGLIVCAITNIYVPTVNVSIFGKSYYKLKWSCWVNIKLSKKREKCQEDTTIKERKERSFNIGLVIGILTINITAGICLWVKPLRLWHFVMAS